MNEVKQTEYLWKVDVLQAKLQLVQIEIQDVCAGFELGFHSELLGQSKKPAGVLGEGLTHRSRAVALKELLTCRHIHKLHLHPQKGISIMDF